MRTAREQTIRRWSHRFLGGFLWLALIVAGGLGVQPAASQAAKKEAKGKPQAAQKPSQVKLRDPFRSLIMRPDEMGAGRPLPPGKRGLIISQLVVNGIVGTPTDYIAVVTMPGRNRAYFLRARDELYDGIVARITEDSVFFRERATDAFGNTYEKEVVKQITGSGAKR